MAILHRLKIETPYAYKYYSHFITNSWGGYVIWSRDGKRYYIDGDNNAKLLLITDNPFKNVTSAKKYLERRIKLKDKFGVKVKH